MDLIGEGQGNGAIVQTFNTLAGQTYNLTFWYTHNFGASAPSFAADAIVSDASGTLLTVSVTHNLPASLTDPNWLLSSSFFTAVSASTTLTFLNTAGGFNGGIYLDDVSVEAVLGETPVPGALPLFAAGLGVFGLIACRRKRKQAT